jgi:putative transposase
VGYGYSLGNRPADRLRCRIRRWGSPLLPSILYALVGLLTDLALLRCQDDRTRDVELLALRHEVRVLRRQVKRTAWQPGDRFVLADLSRRLPRAAWGVLPVRPETLLRWHRELVRRKWAAFGRRRGPGRPSLPADLRRLIERLAAENPMWGYQRIRGELLKLGHDVSATAVRSTLRRGGVPPAPRRTGLSWPAFLRAHAGAVLECDFFVVETVRLQTLHVLFFLEVHSRRAFFVGCTAHPTAAWVTQQARNVLWDLDEADRRPTVLIRDRDTKFPGPFDAVFHAEGVRVVRAPYRAPRAKAHAERWVRTVRREILDWVLILDQRHLERVLREYVAHYNLARPHRALGLRAPMARGQPSLPIGEIVRRDRVAGLVHEYAREAA